MTRIIQRSIPSRSQWQLEQDGIHPLLARLYAARGISEKNEIDYKLASLIPPTELLHTGEAAVLLADALEAQARIVIVGDYDCDGATGTAVAVRALRTFAASIASGAGQTDPGPINYLIPSRFTNGYGLSPSVVDIAAQQFSPDLIITVDNGIASVEGIARARELDISTLITDHHLPGDALPQADCIVNPNQPGCPFPSKNLAGVGVIFYVMLALRAELRARGWFKTNPEPNLGALLDLVALGTVADVVRLDRNNRILVSQGLQRMRKGQMQPGLVALFQAAQKDPARASSFDLGFLLGPRLNAAGRLADMSLGIECLITDNPARAANIAQELNRYNRERREIEAGMLDSALLRLEKMGIGDPTAGAPKPDAGIALFDEEWHQGVVGIVASRIKDKLHRPVFAFARGENGEIKGSGRSIPGLHLRDALDLVSRRAPGLMHRFGGHAAAAGLTIDEVNFPEFRRLFAEVAEELIDPADLTRSLETDGPLEAGYFGLDIVRLLDGEVWGHGFPAPLFVDRFHVEKQRILKEKHLKMTLEKNGARIEAIRFNDASPPDTEVLAAFRLQINDFNGVQTTQLLVEYLENPTGNSAKPTENSR